MQNVDRSRRSTPRCCCFDSGYVSEVGERCEACAPNYSDADWVCRSFFSSMPLNKRVGDALPL